MPIQIVKRDGNTEDFDVQKISRVVQAAGLEPDQADTLANDIHQQVVSSGKTPISSLVIRDLVIGQLHHINESAANLFTWYEKTKDITPAAV